MVLQALYSTFIAFFRSSAGWGLCGIRAARAADEYIRGTILLIRWRRGKWKSRNLLA
jgi:Na+-driven multidrug efflux pump